jgi:hypothetical protein
METTQHVRYDGYLRDKGALEAIKESLEFQAEQLGSLIFTLDENGAQRESIVQNLQLDPKDVRADQNFFVMSDRIRIEL